MILSSSRNLVSPTQTYEGSEGQFLRKYFNKNLDQSFRIRYIIAAVADFSTRESVNLHFIMNYQFANYESVLQ